MGELEAKLYEQHAIEDEAAVKARKILRSGAKKELTNFYRYKGQRYCIVGGRCVDVPTAEKYLDELRQERRTER